MRSLKIAVPFKFTKEFEGFYVFLTLALLARVVLDSTELQRWSIHAGENFPYRHAWDVFPIYSVWTLVIEWALIAIGALSIAWGKVRFGGGLAFLGLLMSLSQMFQNQKVLLLIITGALAVQPLCLKRPESLDFLKKQLCLVYLFTALHKLFGDFVSGKILQILLQTWIADTFWNSSVSLKTFAFITIGVQLAIPILLMKSPRLGLWVAVFFHGTLAVVMKDVWPFTWAMIALALLFQTKEIREEAT